MTDTQAKCAIAANVRRLLSARGLTQSDLCRLTGDNAMRVSYMIRGLTEPSASFLARVAEALGVKVDDLLADPGVEPQAEKVA